MEKYAASTSLSKPEYLDWAESNCLELKDNGVQVPFSCDAVLHHHASSMHLQPKIIGCKDLDE